MAINLRTAFCAITFFQIAILISCRPVSPVKFENPQPAGSKDIASFPEMLFGTYEAAESPSTLKIAAGAVVTKKQSHLFEHKDSLKNYFTVTGDIIIYPDGGRYKFVVKNDTAYWHQSMQGDTIFSIAKGDVLRKFCGHYFLNSKLDDNLWEVRSLNLSGNKLTIGQILDSADVADLKGITNADSDSVAIFNPSRKQFRKYVKGDGFGSQAVYYRTKN